MARENQGLHIALIISVMTIVVLGAMSFWFYRMMDEATTKAASSASELDKTKQQLATTIEERDRLKNNMIGFPAAAAMTDLDKDFKDDMEKYAGAYPEDKRMYRVALAELSKTLKTKTGELAAVKDDLKKLNDEFKAREASKEPQIKKHEEEAAKALKDYAAERGNLESERDKLKQTSAAIEGKRQTLEKEHADAVTKFEAQSQQVESKMKDLRSEKDGLKLKLDRTMRDTVDIPAGTVVRVNQRDRSVHVNLGSADALRRQVNFSVYAADTLDHTTAAKKASLEITEILDDHLAEAQILEDKPGDPVMPGDKIYTLIWSPGERLHFAMVGLMDVNGDGRDDRATVRKLIESNGGIIDCDVNDKGEIKGKLSAGTRYLIMGADVNDKTSKALRDANTQIQDEAKRLGIQQKKLKVFLEESGWRNRTSVVRYGNGANPDDFRAKAPPGGNPVSNGTVSELFKPRNPPKSGVGGAY